MLKNQYKNIVLVGSTSDLGISILSFLPLDRDAKLKLIGRRNPEDYRLRSLNIVCEFKFCNLENIAEVKELFNNPSEFVDSDLVIIAAGLLPPEYSEFDIDIVEKTFLVNSLASIMILSGFARIMASHRKSQILVISSVAGIRPRNRNFTYGASKRSLDFFSIGLQNRIKDNSPCISILRPGYVFSKMTRNYKPAPFALSMDKLGKIASEGLIQRQKIIYAPKKLKLIMNIANILPRFIFDKLA